MAKQQQASVMRFWVITVATFAILIISAILLIDHIEHKLIFGLITSCGAMGGILYATRNQRIEGPHLDGPSSDSYFLGYVSDILGGIGGAYIIFLLLPFDFNRISEPTKAALQAPLPALLPTAPRAATQDFVLQFESIRQLIRIIAVSMIGGYGGRALMARAQADLLGRFQGLEQAMSTQSKLNETSVQLTRLIQKILDIHHPAKREDLRQLDALLQGATAPMSEKVFMDACTVRRACSLKLIGFLRAEHPMRSTLPGASENKTYKEVIAAAQAKNGHEFLKLDKTLQATAVIFKALAKAMADQPDERERSHLHRCFGQLGYAEKDMLFARCDLDNQAKWLEVKDHFERAIHSRDAEGAEFAKAGSGEDEKFGYYELNIAICLMMLSKEFAENQQSSERDAKRIKDYLAKAEDTCRSRGVQLATMFPVDFWLRLNPD